MLLGTYDPGDAPAVDVTFTDASGGAAEATAVTFDVREPGGTITSYTEASPEVTNPAANEWTLQLPAVSTPGVWWVTATATAGLTAVEIGSFRVGYPVVTPAP